MCGRYNLYETGSLASRYHLVRPYAVPPNYNVSPTQKMPVVTENGLVSMRWGLVPAWATNLKIGDKLFNARSESVFEKPIWQKLIMSNRCLVPANGFYEWSKVLNGKQPYFVQMTW